MSRRTYTIDIEADQSNPGKFIALVSFTQDGGTQFVTAETNIATVSDGIGSFGISYLGGVSGTPREFTGTYTNGTTALRCDAIQKHGSNQWVAQTTRTEVSTDIKTQHSFFDSAEVTWPPAEDFATEVTDFPGGTQARLRLAVDV